MRLVGDVRRRGADWEMAEFAGLFERLGANAEGGGVVTRYLRYYGEAEGRAKVRFFGIEVESVEHISRGMVALELGEDTITVLDPGRIGPSVVWQGDLTWKWLERSGAPVGEFAARVPDDWTSQPDPRPVGFVLSANSYFERGRASDDDVHLVEYDPAWPAKFSEMADRLRHTLPPDIAVRIEHYGSTAIPGMPAKPIIDILLEVPSFAEARRTLIPVFNRPECEYWWYNDHMTFVIRKEFMGTRTHHIHAAPVGHRVWQGIVFRDYLRAHQDEAARYGGLKRELAERFAADREAYTDSKDDYVRDVTARARRAVE